jgi:S-disulfanyl-L-cysteine oxidoreductase SoxD
MDTYITSTHKRGAALALLLLAYTQTSLAAAPTPALGNALSAEEAANWNFSVFPDGHGLPPGNGTPLQGKLVYEQRCMGCHGVNGIGGSADELAGAQHSLKDAEPDKTIGNYWPYATTLFDYIRRAMPANAPGSLSNNELYAVTAWLLHLNRLVEATAVLDAKTLPLINMPNRNGFIRIDAPH